MRPHQWVKNTFVLAPLVFAKQIGDALLFGQATAAFIIFCAISGAVYLLNDIFDVESDRAHPIKCNRPIASGVLPINNARVICAALATGAIASAWSLDHGLALVTFIYFALNIAYSSKLKHQPFIDVTVIASGFLLRVLAGSLATGIDVSVFLILCTFSLALFLALGKRHHELRTAVSGAKQRKVLEKYKKDHVQVAMVIMGLVTTGLYIAYTLSPATQEHFSFGWPKLALTIPFTGAGVARFYFLAHDSKRLKSPTEYMLRDRPFLLNILGWCIAVVSLVYLL